eukprot:gnl/Dysnectes_brevis/5858_a8701_366.p1 GENE.gnl/Dysnectes_brevis/5858_a8701_366~~gnl/Dysnectes_brevis/5858_a8701_366.p1  ORF type:complete len:935 (-),score=68.58 gnl/Dysnectes_brevis/5858_a8701_366:73-2877(-)
MFLHSEQQPQPSFEVQTHLFLESISHLLTATVLKPQNGDVHPFLRICSATVDDIIISRCLDLLSLPQSLLLTKEFRQAIETRNEQKARLDASFWPPTFNIGDPDNENPVRLHGTPPLYARVHGFGPVHFQLLSSDHFLDAVLIPQIVARLSWPECRHSTASMIPLLIILTQLLILNHHPALAAHSPSSWALEPTGLSSLPEFYRDKSPLDLTLLLVQRIHKLVHRGGPIESQKERILCSYLKLQVLEVIILPLRLAEASSPNVIELQRALVSKRDFLDLPRLLISAVELHNQDTHTDSYSLNVPPMRHRLMVSVSICMCRVLELHSLTFKEKQEFITYLEGYDFFITSILEAREQVLKDSSEPWPDTVTETYSRFRKYMQLRAHQLLQLAHWVRSSIAGFRGAFDHAILPVLPTRRLLHSSALEAIYYGYRSQYSPLVSGLSPRAFVEKKNLQITTIACAAVIDTFWPSDTPDHTGFVNEGDCIGEIAELAAISPSTSFNIDQVIISVRLRSIPGHRPISPEVLYPSFSLSVSDIPSTDLKQLPFIHSGYLLLVCMQHLEEDPLDARAKLVSIRLVRVWRLSPTRLLISGNLGDAVRLWIMSSKGSADLSTVGSLRRRRHRNRLRWFAVHRSSLGPLCRARELVVGVNSPPIAISLRKRVEHTLLNVVEGEDVADLYRALSPSLCSLNNTGELRLIVPSSARRVPYPGRIPLTHPGPCTEGVFQLRRHTLPIHLNNGLMRLSGRSIAEVAIRIHHQLARCKISAPVGVVMPSSTKCLHLCSVICRHGITALPLSGNRSESTFWVGAAKKLELVSILKRLNCLYHNAPPSQSELISLAKKLGGIDGRRILAIIGSLPYWKGIDPSDPIWIFPRSDSSEQGYDTQARDIDPAHLIKPVIRHLPINISNWVLITTPDQITPELLLCMSLVIVEPQNS